VRSQLPHPKAQEIALNDAMILSYDANLGRMEFSERTVAATASSSIWLDELTADCPKKTARMNDPCGVKCPQLPKVL